MRHKYRYGYRKIAALLRMKCPVNHKCVGNNQSPIHFRQLAV
ncbi:IS3 family transposase [Paenibacillus phoenicis]